MEQLELVLTDFQGPLDLLLHLIRRSQINIYDIPIAQITQQYLDYLHQMQTLKLDIAGDYLVMASTLMRIKSQMLVPQTNFVEEEEVFVKEDDPRSDLVAQLLTYQTYKSVTVTLRQLEEQRQQMAAKNMSLETVSKVVKLKPGVRIANDLAVTMVELLNRQQKVVDKPQISGEKITIEQAQIEIIQQLQSKHSTTFTKLLTDLASVEEVVTKFMGLLELIKSQVLTAQQLNYRADIMVELRS
ncbi:segregation and condensation protein A [Bombilactobacillus thymidiniphilus]|uniref:Segregation and condensation protein A n=1 Tax=Bombilactobacillus thymidiniphilus TaxID=2923363 RepID=A0ABY4PE04_9LACO|nr:segregation/condensation protein A [Bombilactobacillus thymidiniphilus]UQS83724.1 segregation/condensation protein A [Bombilactobacillus thymidiniphilus]